MFRAVAASFCLALVGPSAWAQDPPKLPLPKPAADPKPLEEVWEAAYVLNDGKDVKIGHIHMTSVPVTKDGVKLIRTTKELRFQVARGESAAEMKADVSTDEDAAGKVKGVKAKIGLGRDLTQTLDCEIIDDAKIVISADGQLKNKWEFRWDPACVGLAGEQTLLRDKKAKPGDAFTYRYFEPQVTNYVRVQVAVKAQEKVDVPGGAARELLKVVATPDPLMTKDGQKIQMPAATYYADPASYDVIKTVMDVPEIGKVTLLRTSKVAALAPNGQVPDLMKRQSVYLKAPVPRMFERAGLVYRVTYQGDAKPTELVKTDARQAIENVRGNTFDLRITPRREPAKIKGAVEAKVAAEFTKSNFFLTSDDAEVRKLAAQAVGRATEPLTKARQIERWVRDNMKVANFTEAMAPASHVAKTLTGDCTEYAMLSAAMCKAQGVPARTAIGLVYVDNLFGKPGLAFHMWTEVFVSGEWIGLDATFGRGSIGPGHIKITDHSWDGVISFTPLLPVKGFIMASPAVEVVE